MEDKKVEPSRDTQIHESIRYLKKLMDMQKDTQLYKNMYVTLKSRYSVV